MLSVQRKPNNKLLQCRSYCPAPRRLWNESSYINDVLPLQIVRNRQLLVVDKLIYSLVLFIVEGLKNCFSPYNINISTIKSEDRLRDLDILE